MAWLHFLAILNQKIQKSEELKIKSSGKKNSKWWENTWICLFVYKDIFKFLPATQWQFVKKAVCPEAQLVWCVYLTRDALLQQELVATYSKSGQ